MNPIYKLKLFLLQIRSALISAQIRFHERRIQKLRNRAQMELLFEAAQKMRPGHGYPPDVIVAFARRSRRTTARFTGIEVEEVSMNVLAICFQLLRETSGHPELLNLRRRIASNARSLRNINERLCLQ